MANTTVIKVVQGNVLRLNIPLQVKIRNTEQGEPTERTEDFYPSLAYPTIVKLTSDYKTVNLDAEVDGNVVKVEDKGTLKTGCYQIEVICKDDNGNPYRFAEPCVIHVVNYTKDADIEAGVEYEVETYTLEGAYFIQGEKGDKGDKGDKGEQGERGIQGAQGERGIQGEQGVQGIQGERGEKGEKGDKGDTGATGAKGDKGDKGEKGATGAQGVGISRIDFKEVDPLGGNVYTITLTSGSTAEFTAPRGTQGIQGIQGATGVGIARATLNADYTLTLTFTDGTSTTTTSIRGEKGEKGDKGDKGDTGTTNYNDLTNKPDLSVFIEKSNTSGLVKNDGTIDTNTYLTQHQDISGKADKSEMSVVNGTGTDADKTTITLKNGTSATVLKSHQDISGKQETLVSGTNIKTINNESILGSGNISVAAELPSNLAYTSNDNGEGIIPSDGIRAESVTSAATMSINPDVVTVINGAVGTAAITLQVPQDNLAHVWDILMTTDSSVAITFAMSNSATILYPDGFSVGASKAVEISVIGVGTKYYLRYGEFA